MPFGEQGTALLGEFLGTFLFVVTIPLAHLGVGPLAPLPTGFMLSAMVFSFGYVSGGHFNPAITFATLFIGQFTLAKALKYILTQVLAAVLATLYGTIIVGVDIPAPGVTPHQRSLLGIWQTLCTEGVFTFALATVVLHCTCSRQQSNHFYGLAIGMALIAASFAVGGFVSGAFNPASATAATTVRCLMAHECAALWTVWVFWAAPMAGAFVAALLYNVLDTEPPKRRVDDVNTLADFH